MERPVAPLSRLAILAATLLLSLAGFGCSSGAAPQQQGSSEPPPPETVLDDLVLDRLEEGRLNQRILAKRATYRETAGQQYAWLENVKVEFYAYDDGAEGGAGLIPGAPTALSDAAGDEAAAPPSLDAPRRLAGSLWANAAALYLDNYTTDSVKLLLEERGYPDVEAMWARPNNMDLLGDVQYRVEKEDEAMGDAVMTKHLRWDSQELWDEDEGVLRGAGWFRIIRPAKDEGGAALVIEGEGFQSNRDMQRWRYTRTQIKSEKLGAAGVAALLPEPRADAPRYDESAQ